MSERSGMGMDEKDSGPPNRQPNWPTISPEKIIGILWRRRWRLLLIGGLFGLVGVAVALLTTPEYVSEARIVPEMNQSSGDMFRKLASAAGFAGIDFGDAEGLDAVRPDLYPNVLQSMPFILYLLERPVLTKDGTRKTVSAILLEHRTVFGKGVSSEQTDAVRKGNARQPVRLTQEQQDLLEDIQTRISARMDTRSGIITISAKMPDPVAVAAVTQLAMDYLTQYVTTYRTGKVRQDLQFYTNRLNEARKRFETAQYNLYQYNDRHKYMIVQAATMEKKQLEAELAISETVYSELAKQHEQAKIKVQERTPVFKVLEPPKIPLKRVSPRRTVLVFMYTMVGFMVGSLFLIIIGSGTLGIVRQRMREVTTA
ncbi:Wzz/FepE/Etk N-terminal domain-containing protein [Larkinella bovis]|uniref:Wzz/FepE/Etk N-terminal domain-containing protein n=1 Tax=Larkinella bovis TaxID=683041 RepID=A0ABW0I6J5_9BACT